MDLDLNAMNIFPGFGFQYTKKRPYNTDIKKMWHPGFAWACTRKAYKQMDELYELSILGAGDHNMALSFIGKANVSLNENVDNNYLDSVLNFQQNSKRLRLGYVPGVIRHYFHGSKKNRKYSQRWQILVKHKYNPSQHITKRSDGLLIPTTKCPKELLDDIFIYFKERNEDEGVEKTLKNLKI
jgi:hypothetical protein